MSHRCRRPSAELLLQARQRLPLPQLLTALGLERCCKKSCKSPFRTERNPSFGIFQKEGRWWWKDHGTGRGGDEIAFLAFWTDSPRKDAFKAYLQMAEVTVE